MRVHFASDQKEHLMQHSRCHSWSAQRLLGRPSVKSRLLMHYARDLHARRSNQAMQRTAPRCVLTFSHD